MISWGMPEYKVRYLGMPTRSSTAKKKPAPKRTGTAHDFTVTARRVVEQAIGEKLSGEPLDDTNASKNPAAVALGRLGGVKGGKARAEALSPAKRKAIAKKAAAARWKR
jgi:hypothetical protein